MNADDRAALREIDRADRLARIASTGSGSRVSLRAPGEPATATTVAYMTDPTDRATGSSRASFIPKSSSNRIRKIRRAARAVR